MAHTKLIWELYMACTVSLNLTRWSIKVINIQNSIRRLIVYKSYIEIQGSVLAIQIPKFISFFCRKVFVKNKRDINKEEIFILIMKWIYLSIKSGLAVYCFIPVNQFSFSLIKYSCKFAGFTTVRGKCCVLFFICYCLLFF